MKRPGEISPPGNCANCRHFSKYRGINYGQCNNDDVFQYADNKEDLKNFNNDSLIIMGNAVTVVGTDYWCGAYVSRKEKESPTETKDYRRNAGFTPPAERKHRMRGSVTSF